MPWHKLHCEKKFWCFVVLAQHWTSPRALASKYQVSQFMPIPKLIQTFLVVLVKASCTMSAITYELYTTNCAFHHCVGGRLAHSKLQLKGVIISSFHTIPYHCHPTTSYHNTIILTYHTLPYYWSINILHPIILSLSYYHPSEQTSLISMPELKIRNDSIHGVSSRSSGNLWN